MVWRSKRLRPRALSQAVWLVKAYEPYSNPSHYWTTNGALWRSVVEKCFGEVFFFSRPFLTLQKVRASHITHSVRSHLWRTGYHPSPWNVVASKKWYAQWCSQTTNYSSEAPDALHISEMINALWSQKCVAPAICNPLRGKATHKKRQRESQVETTLHSENESIWTSRCRTKMKKHLLHHSSKGGGYPVLKTQSAP